MEQKNELAIVNGNGNGEVTINFFANEANFNLGQRMAKVFATSTLVPQQYQGNIGNTMIAMNMAQRMSADPLMVMQNLCIVHGTPSFEAKFAIACFNATGKYTPIRYEEVGEKGKDSYGMYAYAIDKATGDVLKGPEITIGLAKAEGWYQQNPKWRNVPQLMLRYRAASWFIRTTDPGVMLGFQTKEEVEDVDYVEMPTDNQPSLVPQDDANAETIDIDAKQAPQPQATKNAAETVENADVDKLPNDEKKTQQNAKKEANSQVSSSVPQGDMKPMGKQPTPDLFK